MNKLDLKPGDVGFLMQHDNWVSRAIAWFMGSRWSHTFLVADIGHFQIYTSETCEFIVHTGEMYPKLRDKAVEMEVYRPPFNQAQIVDVVRACQENHGEIYGYLQLFSFAVVCMIQRIFGVRIRNFIRQGMVCNQHVMYGYSRHRGTVAFGVDPENYHTEDFYRMIQASGLPMVFSKKRGEVK